MNRRYVFTVHTAAVILLLFGTVSESFAARYALIIGRNDGGLSVDSLRYAQQDAERFSSVLTRFGGFPQSNVRMLIAPDNAALEKSFGEISSLIRKSSGENNFFLFYYSGHADREYIQLGKERVAFKKLIDRIESVAANIRVSIFDACHSGTVTRFKGGTLGAPFFLENVQEVKGRVVISSSAANEQAQESEALKGSVFTYHWINGLRGSADFSSDKRITLNEAYQYAYRKTIETTAVTGAGVQHPSYQFKIHGQSEIVLTDLSQQTTGIVCGTSLQGKFVILSENYRHLLADFYKEAGKELFIALDPGSYTAFSLKGAETAVYTFSIDPQSIQALNSSAFTMQPTVLNVVKGTNSYAADRIISREADQAKLLGRYLRSVAVKRKHNRIATSSILFGIGALSLGGSGYMVSKGLGEPDNKNAAIGLAAIGGIAGGLGVLRFMFRPKEKVYDTYSEMKSDDRENLDEKIFYGEHHFQDWSENAKMKRISSGFGDLSSGGIINIFKGTFTLVNKSEMERLYEQYTREKQLLYSDFGGTNTTGTSASSGDSRNEPYRNGSNADGSNKYGLGVKIGEGAGVLGVAFSYNFNESMQVQIGSGFPTQNSYRDITNNSILDVHKESHFVLGRYYLDFLYFDSGVAFKNTRLVVTDNRENASDKRYGIGIPFHVGFEYGKRNRLYIGGSIGYMIMVYGGGTTLEAVTPSGVRGSAASVGSGPSFGVAIGYYFL